MNDKEGYDLLEVVDTPLQNVNGGGARGRRALFAYKMLQWHANIKPLTVKFHS
jgi:hypothetical protein